MTRLLHISDLHFGPPFLPRVGEALVRGAAEAAPDGIVVSGDLTQRARPAQFEAAKAFIDRLPDVPKLIVPGNHDVALHRLWERWFHPYALYRRHIDDRLDLAMQIGDVRLVGLNSTSPRRAISNGRIDPKQLEFCRESLADVPSGTARVVVAHHHFAPAPDYLHDETMPKSKRAMATFQKLGVEMILGGHLHRAYIGNSLDFYPGDRRDRGITIVQCGTSTSRRGRGREKEKNSFNVIEVEEREFRITHWMYFDELEAFRPQSQHRFPRRGREIAI
ncbi:MAG TPA: 3',5'-cyclic-nucleotide phosphodiesterase [Planctomycetaceae bacterium]|nr:3',5'-cyclic-nucleotide phosphodiesterase [Planctomycetaceae bacterium]HRE99167.1 metallophosphoesterase [Pirellulaceae bacterium]